MYRDDEIKKLVEALEKDEVSLVKYSSVLEGIDKRLFSTKRGLVYNKLLENCEYDVKEHTVVFNKDDELSIGDAEDNKVIIGDSLLSLKKLKSMDASVDVAFIDTNNIEVKNIISNYNSKSHEDIYYNYYINRVMALKKIMSRRGVAFIFVDKYNLGRVQLMSDKVFGKDNFIDILMWDKSKNASSSRFISNSVNYIIVYAKDMEHLIENDFKFTTITDEDKYINSILEDAKDYGENEEDLQHRIRDLYKLYPNKYFRLKNYNNIEEGTYRLHTKYSLKGNVGKRQFTYDIINPFDNKVYKNKDGWLFSENRMKKLIEEGRVIFPEKDGDFLMYKVYFDENLYTRPNSYFKIPLVKDWFEKEITEAGNTVTPSNVFKSLLGWLDYENRVVLSLFIPDGIVSQAVFENNKELKIKDNVYILEETYNDSTLKRLDFMNKGMAKGKNKYEPIDFNVGVYNVDVVKDFNINCDDLNESLIKDVIMVLKSNYKVSSKYDKLHDCLYKLESEDKVIYLYLKEYMEISVLSLIQHSLFKKSIIYTNQECLKDTLISKFDESYSINSLLDK